MKLAVTHGRQAYSLKQMHVSWTPSADERGWW